MPFSCCSRREKERGHWEGAHCSDPRCPRLWGAGSHYRFPEGKWPSSPVLSCDFPSQETPQELCMNTFVPKNRSSQNAALGLALSHRSWCWRGGDVGGGAASFPRGLADILFPIPAFLCVLSHEFWVCSCTCD